jgi:hypothetical protein
MNGVNPSGASPALPVDVYYPDGDCAPRAETGIHVLVMTALIATLRYCFRQRQDVCGIGNVFLYYEEGNPQARRSPDDSARSRSGSARRRNRAERSSWRRNWLDYERCCRTKQANRDHPISPLAATPSPSPP